MSSNPLSSSYAHPTPTLCPTHTHARHECVVLVVEVEVRQVGILHVSTRVVAQARRHAAAAARVYRAQHRGVQLIGGQVIVGAPCASIWSIHDLT